MTANQISYWNLQESKRHNVTSEREVERSNRAKEYLTDSSNREVARHNLAVEGLDERKHLHNVLNEGQKRSIEQGHLNEEIFHNARTREYRDAQLVADIGKSALTTLGGLIKIGRALSTANSGNVADVVNTSSGNTSMPNTP